MSKVCSHKHVKSFDNALRPLIHNGRKLFGAYVRPGMRVLDIGCGAGFATEALAGMVGASGHVFAIDVQQEMLDLVSLRLKRKGLSERVSLQLCQSDALGVAGSFDFINAFWVVHEVDDDGVFFRQSGAVLSDSGVMFVAEPLFHVGRQRFERMIDTAVAEGLVVRGRPRVWLSRAVIFSNKP